MVQGVNESAPDPEPQVVPGVLTMLVGHGAEHLCQLLLKHAALAAVRLGPPKMEVPPMACVYDGFKNGEPDTNLVLQVVADLSHAVVMNAVHRVTVAHYRERFTLGRLGNPLLPELLPKRPHLELQRRRFVHAPVVELDPTGRTKTHPAPAVQIANDDEVVHGLRRHSRPPVVDHVGASSLQSPRSDRIPQPRRRWLRRARRSYSGECGR